MVSNLKITILGLSITSSWGNGHATTYRGLVKALCRRGHRVLFLEHDKPWYADNRDLPHPPFGITRLYRDLTELRKRYVADIRDSDLVIVGSYVPQGREVGQWTIENARGTVAFYDIDTPITEDQVARQQCEYLSPELIRQYDLYLSFSGGKILEHLEKHYGAKCARPLYCAFDPEEYDYVPMSPTYDLGYMGTYSDDRQPTIDRLMLDAAKQWPEGRFVVAGPQYPDQLRWPDNVLRIEHLPPVKHREFFNSQRYTLNVTRQAMIRWGYSPSVRLFEAAACGVPIISDWWVGLDDLFIPNEEILISSNACETLQHVRGRSDAERLAIGEAAKAVVFARHTADCRAAQLESYLAEIDRKPKPSPALRASVSSAEIPQRYSDDSPHATFSDSNSSNSRSTR